MISAPLPAKSGVSAFRVKLFAAMMLVISAVTALALYFAQRQLASDAEKNLKRRFKSELAALHSIQRLRHAALAERCRTLAKNARLHAALEDNAIDLLYPNAKDELRDIMVEEEEDNDMPVARTLHASFYRFLDGKGGVIVPRNLIDAGQLTPQEESQLALGGVPREQQIGYLFRSGNDGGVTIYEIIAMPIMSSETDQAIAAIVFGFETLELGNQAAASGIKTGVWLNGRLHFQSATNHLFAREVAKVMAPPDRAEKNSAVTINGAPHLVFYKQLNPASLFPPAYEVCVYPLNDLRVRQRQVRWQIAGAGVILLLVAFGASHFISARLSVPVKKLAIDSAENRAQRESAEAALQLTSQELQRTARFSANTSHQLKTPITVLRAGLEELLAREKLSAEAREEIAALIHQTFRVTSIVEDLLLLSQMDAGRLQINFGSVDLTRLIETQIDDLSALPDGLDLEVECDCTAFSIAGEERYVTLILQNLLENARKYNRPGGRIRIAAREDGDWAIVTIGNTGHAIASSAREHIFERFHRGDMGENVAGHGLGLNLARELARLHGGDLRLVRSADDWTEFEVRFRCVREKIAPAEVT
jgi:signal transduction histidine kinase